MAIFAASYAVPQRDSFDEPGAGVGGGLFLGLADDEGLFRKRGIADARTTKCKSRFFFFFKFVFLSRLASVWTGRLVTYYTST